MQIRVMQIRPSARAMSRIAFMSLGAILIFSGIGKIVKTPPLENIFFAGFIGEYIPNILRQLLPYAEIIIGGLLAFRVKVKIVSWVALAAIMMFITNNVWLISIGKGWESCGQCLGWGIDTWVGASLYIDLMMLGILLFGAYQYQNERTV